MDGDAVLNVKTPTELSKMRKVECVAYWPFFDLKMGKQQ